METVWKKILDRMDQEVVLTDGEDHICWMNRYARENEEMQLCLNKQFDGCFTIQVSETEEAVLCSGWGELFSFEKESLGYENLYFMENLTSFKNPRIQRECYKEIVDKLDVMGTSYKGEIVIASSMAAEYYGTSQEELYNRSLPDFYNYHSEEEQEHKKVMETGVPIVNNYSNRPYSAKNYVYRPLMYSTYPFAYRGRNILAYTIVHDDKKAQEILREVTELRRRLHLRDLQDEKHKEDNDTSYSFLDIIGESRLMEDTIGDAQTIAGVDRNLLIVGETGTGKEVFAQSIHNYSSRGREPFVPINCAAIPENLLESILFGTVKGSYTGAVDSEGLFELAGTGTVFLDELNSMPVSMQTKLLRVLQEKKAMRVGGHKLYPIACRIISAVNEEPRQLIKSGKLRNDLFYRIAPLSLYIPPLRERPEDILALNRHYIEKYNRLFYKDVTGVDPEMERLLLDYPWPGNVRELDYVIENMMIRSGGGYLKLSDLPPHLRGQFKEAERSETDPGETDCQKRSEPRETDCQVMVDTEGKSEEAEENQSLLEALEEYEAQLITQALMKQEGNQKKAAESLGISRQNLHYRIKRLNGCKEIDT